MSSSPLPPSPTPHQPHLPGLLAGGSLPITSNLPAGTRGSMTSTLEYLLDPWPSSHLYHVPVDQVLFLEARVRRKVKGQATLVTSEGGHAHFWDIFSTAQPLGTYDLHILLPVHAMSPLPGRFPLTPHEEEVVLALATDDSCQWLLAGDTAGHLSLFNIAQYCITPQEVRL